MTLDEPTRPSPLGRVLGWVWMSAGGVAIVVGLATAVVAISVFGLLAAVLGASLIAFANLRLKSEARTARTLAGNPPLPADAPYAAPAAADSDPDDEPAPEDEPVPRRPRARPLRRRGPRGTAAQQPDVRVSASDVEDGFGEQIQPPDRPR